MNRKKILIIISAVFALLLCLGLYKTLFPREYKVKEDEIAMKIKLDLQEDIGLIVYDYTVNGHEFGGGISNADKSLIRKNEELIDVWSKEDIRFMLGEEDNSEYYRFTMTIRIITDYVDPNFENVYPEDITRYLEPIEWTASFGNEYDIHITGNKTDGYKIIMN